ncbi:DHHW family protein [Virgibacillus sp. MG-45]|uniref:DHHW family protein n=1 Tax=Virgibacillus sp. MG-45 TaxID=3102791 RepID=UPI002ED780FF
MRKSIGEIILAIAFVSIIFGFGMWSLLKEDDSSSVLENRKLSHRPDATVENLFSGEYFKQFETYYNDQFPLRSLWIEKKTELEKTAFQQRFIKSTYISKDGYLIPTLVSNDKQRSPEEIAKRIKSFAANINNKKVDVYFALVPNKTTMMEDKLPTYIRSEANVLSDRLIDALSNNNNIVPLDIRDTIKPHMNEENLYFYTDHHWKPRAAYYAYASIINKIKEKHSIVSPKHLNDFDWEESEVEFLGSDARTTTEAYVRNPDTITIVKPAFQEQELDICFNGKCGRSFNDERYLKLKDKYTNRYKTYFSGDVDEAVIQNPNIKDDQKLLILKDSYANPILQFIARNFSETRVLDLRHYKENSIYQYIEENNIDYVLFIHNINSLVTTPSLTNIK